MMIRFRKAITLLLTILMITALPGCTYQLPAVPAGEDASSEAGVSEIDPSVDTGAPEEVPEGTDAADEAPADSGVTTGGSPWIDSDIKANLTEDMELSIKDDFNLAVNYDWLMNADIPEGKPAYNVFYEAGESIEENIAKYMDDKAAEGQSHEADLARTFYHALLDWEARDKTGFEPALEKITAIKEIKDTNELTSFLCDMKKSCFVPSGVDIFNDPYFDDSTRYIVKIDDINTGLILKDSSEYKERTEMGEVYYQAAKELTESVLTRAGFSKDESDSVFEGAIEYETFLAKEVPAPAELNSPEYYKSITNVYDMDSLKELYKAYPIEELLEARGYGGAEQYQVTTPDYAANLGSLYNEENLELIKDYMLVHFCINAVNKLDSETFKAYNRYRNTMYGTSGNISDTYYATNMARTFLPDAMTKVYVDYYHLEDSKEKVKKICEDIIAVYEDMLMEEDWLSAEMKEKAVEKLQCMKIHSVYPDKLMDYDNLELTGDSLFGYFEQVETFNMRHDASYTGQPVDNAEWNFIH
nr:hypothetical protein [Lachnospiraceae bacterium]